MLCTEVFRCSGSSGDVPVRRNDRNTRENKHCSGVPVQCPRGRTRDTGAMTRTDRAVSVAQPMLHTPTTETTRTTRTTGTVLVFRPFRLFRFGHGFGIDRNGIARVSDNSTRSEE